MKSKKIYTNLQENYRLYYYKSSSYSLVGFFQILAHSVVCWSFHDMSTEWKH